MLIFYASLGQIQAHELNDNIYSSTFTGTSFVVQCKESTCQHRRPEFNPLVRKIFWRRKWQPTLKFLPEKSHGQRSLVGYSPWGCKKSDKTEWPILLLPANNRCSTLKDPDISSNPKPWCQFQHKENYIYHSTSGVVLRWQRNRMGRPLSSPQIHQKIIWMLSNFWTLVEDTWHPER